MAELVQHHADEEQDDEEDGEQRGTGTAREPLHAPDTRGGAERSPVNLKLGPCDREQF